MTEYLRMSGMYWGITALDLLDGLSAVKKEDVIQQITECQHESGGICPAPGHDPHILYTLSAIQVSVSVIEKMSARCIC